MLKRTLFMAAVMAAPVVAEAQRRGGGQGPGWGGGSSFNEFRATRIATRIGNAASNLAIESRMIAQRARANGKMQRAQKFADLRYNARQLAKYYRQTVLPVLGSNARDQRKKNLVRQSRPYFVAVDTAFASIFRKPYDISDLYSDIKDDQAKLRRVVFGGGGVGPVPPRGNWYGSCEVVLETLWGTNIRSFYGQSVAPTRSLASQQAKMKAMQKCRRNVSGFLMCTVAGNCGASRR